MLQLTYQVKIRGWRIEILEIEHQIRTACGPKVGVAVEIRNPTQIPGQEMLLAFLEFQNYRDHEGTASFEVLWEELASSETLFAKMVNRSNARLRKYLPSYMLPSAYVPIRTLPMTNIFKLNRRVLREKANALKISDIQSPSSNRGRKQEDLSSSKDERVLRQIWAEVLHIPLNEADSHEDFFRTGGDSLKAMTVVSTARRQGMDISVAKLYRFRNITELAHNIGEEAFDEVHDRPFSLLDAADAVRIQAMAVEQCCIDSEMVQDIMPLTDMQHYYVSSQVQQPGSWMCTIAFDLPPGTDMERVKHAWEQLTAHHPIMRTRFVNTPLGLFQVILKSEILVWSPGSDISGLLKTLKAEIRGFGFPPHAHALLVEKDQMPSRLIWHAHHGLHDFLMNELLSQDLALLCGDQSHSLAKRPAFKRVIQHRLGYDETASITFWHSHLNGARYKALFESNRVIDVLANGRLSQEAEIKFPAWLQVSEYALAMAALALALVRVTGVEDLAFILIRSGRISGMPGSENVMGPLLARAPMRICVQRKRRIVDMLHDVHRGFDEARNHEIVRLNDFEKVSPEAAAHLKHAVYLNFTPPSLSWTLGPDSMLPVDSDFLDGSGDWNQIISFFGMLFRGKMKMDVIYDEEAISHSLSQRLLDEWKAMLHLLSKVDSEVMVEHILIT